MSNEYNCFGLGSLLLFKAGLSVVNNLSCLMLRILFEPFSTLTFEKKHTIVNKCYKITNLPLD